MSEWIEWSGGGCPVQTGLLVECKFRNGKGGTAPSDKFSWEHTGDQWDLVEYRVSEAFAPLTTQVAGSHYKDMKIQPVEFIHANNLGFLEGCIVKRICRWRKKDGIQDLEKIKHEVDLLIALEKGNG